MGELVGSQERCRLADEQMEVQAAAGVEAAEAAALGIKFGWGGLLAGQGRGAATDTRGDLSQRSWAYSVQQDDSEKSAEL